MCCNFSTFDEQLRAWTDAASSDDVEEMKRILEHDSLSLLQGNNNLVNSIHPDHERTALHLAAAWNAKHSVAFLLKLGGDACTVDATGSTPVHLTIDDDSAAALHAIIRHLSDDVVKCRKLLNKRNGAGFTPLHLCATTNAVKCCRLLLSTTLIDTTIVAPQFFTALDIAMQHNHHEIIALLKETTG